MISITNSPLKNVAVIFAGGEGKRLWPISTTDLPKQLNPFFSAQPLIISAYDRARRSFSEENIIFVIHEGIEAEFRKIIDVPEKQLIIQPKNMDTSVAMALTSLYLEALYPDSLATLFYSDHLVQNLKSFDHDLKQASKLAHHTDMLVAIGTHPTSPETTLGYIKQGAPVENFNQAYEVDEFVEKPNLETAKKYLKTKKYLWNTGLYVCKNTVLLENFKQIAPDIYQQLLMLRIEFFGENFNQKLHTWFSKLEKPLTFEKEITEKIKNLLVYKASFNWQDIGNWTAFYNSLETDVDGVAAITKNQPKLLDVTNTLIVSNLSEVVMLGVKDLIVVQNDDNLLICHKDYAGKVKEALAQKNLK